VEEFKRSTDSWRARASASAALRDEFAEFLGTAGGEGAAAAEPGAAAGAEAGPGERQTKKKRRKLPAGAGGGADNGADVGEAEQRMGSGGAGLGGLGEQKQGKKEKKKRREREAAAVLGEDGGKGVPGADGEKLRRKGKLVSERQDATAAAPAVAAVGGGIDAAHGPGDVAPRSKAKKRTKQMNALAGSADRAADSDGGELGVADAEPRRKGKKARKQHEAAAAPGAGEGQRAGPKGGSTAGCAHPLAQVLGGCVQSKALGSALEPMSPHACLAERKQPAGSLLTNS